MPCLRRRKLRGGVRLFLYQPVIDVDTIWPACFPLLHQDIQSSGQPDELDRQMEVWFYSRIETAAERPTPRDLSRTQQGLGCAIASTYFCDHYPEDAYNPL